MVVDHTLCHVDLPDPLFDQTSPDRVSTLFWDVHDFRNHRVELCLSLRVDVVLVFLEDREGSYELVVDFQFGIDGSIDRVQVVGILNVPSVSVGVVLGVPDRV